MLDRWETPLEVKEVDLHKSKTERLLQAFDNVSQILSASILRHEPKYKARNEEALELMMSESSRVPTSPGHLRDIQGPRRRVEKL